MSKSQNDKNFMGGTIREKFTRRSGKVQIIVNLLNPGENRPCTNAELVAAVQQRAQEFPLLAEAARKQIDEVEKKAADKPDSVVAWYHIDADKEKAKKYMEEVVLPEYLPLMRLLYHDDFANQVESGNVTVRDYTVFNRENLFNGMDADKAKRMQTALDKYVLPVVGDDPLNKFDHDRQNAAIKKINAKLKKLDRKDSLRYSVKAAYKLLFDRIGERYVFSCRPVTMADMIDVRGTKNRQIRDAYRCGHMDDKDRSRLMTDALRQQSAYRGFVLGLIYSGFDSDEMAELQFKDFRVLRTESGEKIYWINVDRIAHQAAQKCSTLKATTETFCLDKYRVLVLSPWAGKRMEAYLDELKQAGASDCQIAAMRLTSRTLKGERIRPKDLEGMVACWLQEAEITASTVMRTDKDGRSRLETIPLDFKFVRSDAAYVAEKFCGMDPVMIHASFGTPWTEVDERSYLALSSYFYTCCRYYHLRRFSPIALDAMKDEQDEFSTSVLHITGGNRGLYVLEIRNTTESRQTIKLRGDFGFRAAWEVK